MRVREIAWTERRDKGIQGREEGRAKRRGNVSGGWKTISKRKECKEGGKEGEREVRGQAKGKDEPSKIESVQVGLNLLLLSFWNASESKRSCKTKPQ
jgi:hypothetical protein